MTTLKQIKQLSSKEGAEQLRLDLQSAIFHLYNCGLTVPAIANLTCGCERYVQICLERWFERVRANRLIKYDAELGVFNYWGDSLEGEALERAIRFQSADRRRREGNVAIHLHTLVDIDKYEESADE